VGPAIKGNTTAALLLRGRALLAPRLSGSRGSPPCAFPALSPTRFGLLVVAKPHTSGVHLWWGSRWSRRLLVVTGARCPLTKPVVAAVELRVDHRAPLQPGRAGGARRYLRIRGTPRAGSRGSGIGLAPGPQALPIPAALWCLCASVASRYPVQEEIQGSVQKSSVISWSVRKFNGTFLGADMNFRGSR
jgi:hypothetical protein